MSQIAKVEPKGSEIAALNESATLLQVIHRAATDPQCDLDKMERLMAMHERVQAKQAEAQFNTDLAEMQDALPSIGERGVAQRGERGGTYTYALWEDINAAIKPVLKRWGFALTFRTDFADGIAVTGVLTHKAGHKIETTIKLPADTGGGKNPVQAVASSVSYGKRYTAAAVLNLTSHGEDDDAFAASGPEFDCTAWFDAIHTAGSKDELDKIAAEIKDNDIPGIALKRIRAAWAARAAALRGA